MIKLNHVRTNCQLADLLTKALSYNQFSNLACKMGMLDIHTPAALEGEYYSSDEAGKISSKSKEEASKNKSYNSSHSTDKLISEHRQTTL